MTGVDSMSEPGTIGTDGLQPTAGAMLRAAREQRGIHIAALAASLKVPQRKLEALEADRYDELLDLTFTRALAQGVCRTLKIDFEPVLERLPQTAQQHKLGRLGEGLNAPYRERSTREKADLSLFGRPVVWGTLLVLAGAAALALLPENLLRGNSPVRPSPPAASAPAAPASTGAVVVPPVVAAMPVAAEPLTTVLPVAMEGAASAPTVTAPLAFRTQADSWIEVQDGAGQTLLSRNVVKGESLELEGAVPLRVTVGNATATQLLLRGQMVDLSANTVGNVARIQLD
jgi:cytoskeleton protein RodZ